MQRQKERAKAMIKHICRDCNQQFNQAQQKQVPDHTGFDGIYIEVCPNCCSNLIEPISGLHTIILDKTEVELIAKMATLYVGHIAESKSKSTEIVLKDHYTALMMQANDLVEKIIKSKND